MFHVKHLAECPVHGRPVHPQGGGERTAVASCRKHVWYSGQVQGVGFRFTARGVARRYRVTGVVRNLSDGRVEIIVEGEAAEVSEYLVAVDREMAGYIHRREVVEEQAAGEFESFAVAF